MSIQFGATCFFNRPDEFSLVAEVAKNFPFMKYVEFRGEHPFLFPEVTDYKELEKYKNILNQSGLKSTLHTTMYDINLATLNPWIKEANIVCYKKFLEIAKLLGSEIIVVHAGDLYEEFVDSSLKEKFISTAENNLSESLYELAEYGQGQGVKVALENSPPKRDLRMVHDVESHIHILDKVNHPNLGAVLDFAHAFLNKLGLINYLERIRPHLFEIHAHNNFGIDDEHLGLHNGAIDYKPILNHPAIKDVPFIMEIVSYEEVMGTLNWLNKLEL
jgi:sugar phosphate isomerase/epimerase